MVLKVNAEDLTLLVFLEESSLSSDILLQFVQYSITL